MKLEVTEGDIHMMSAAMESWAGMLHEVLDDQHLKETDPESYEIFEQMSHRCERLSWRLESLSAMFHALKATAPEDKETWLTRMREAETRFAEMTV